MSTNNNQPPNLKPTKREGIAWPEGLFAANQRQSLRQVLMEAAAAGGERRPGPLADYILQSLVPGGNPKRVAARTQVDAVRKTCGLPEKACWIMSASRFSEKVARLRLGPFVHKVNEFLQANARRMLTSFPPTGRQVNAIIDGHEYEYFFEAHRHRDGRACRKPNHRHQFMRYAHSSNKRSRYANEWVVTAIQWSSGSERFTLPIAVQPAYGRFDPAHQLGPLIQWKRRYHIPVRAVLLDRYYDAQAVRDLADRNHLRLGWRMVMQRHGKTIVRLKDFKAYVSTQKLTDEAVAKGEFSSWTDKATGEIHLQRHVSYLGTLQGSDRIHRIVAAARVLPDGAGKWKAIPRANIMLAFPEDFSADQALRTYRRRWAIEAMFYQWSLDATKPRSQIIETHVVLYAARVMHLACAMAVLQTITVRTGARSLLISIQEALLLVLEFEEERRPRR